MNLNDSFKNTMVLRGSKVKGLTLYVVNYIHQLITNPVSVIFILRFKVIL